jgi:site-specific recombinase XerD
VNKIATAWASTLERARITRRLRPYDLRHLFVTRAIERGAALKPLAEIVGSRPETLMRFYQHVSAAAHRQTINLIPPAPGDTPQIITTKNK